jgi:type I restriction enzyme S subunit
MTFKSSRWEEVPLKRILTYLDDRIELDDLKEYSTITVKRRHGGLEEREKLLGREIKTKKQFRLMPGAFIISRVQCWHQAYAVVPDSAPPNMIASTNYDQFLISPDVDRRFFWWLSHSPKFTESVRSSAVGVVIEKMVFDRDAWLEKEIPLPPLPEQRRIVARIEELAARINEARGLRQKSAVEAQNFVLSVHNRLAGDRKRKLGDFLTLDEQQVLVTLTEEYPQVGVKGFGGGLFPKAPVSGTDTTYTSFNRLYDGALVLSQVKGWRVR